MIELIIILACLVFVILILIGWVAGTYNDLVTDVQDIETQFSNIKTEYQRRADLFYNLVESVKSHVKFEKSTITEVTRLRNVTLGKEPKVAKKQMAQMDGAFARLLATFEAYPKLQSVQLYQQTMEELRITEDRVNVARTDFNDVIRVYNTKVKTFPSNIIARMYGFIIKEYFMNEPSTDKCPKISYEDKQTKWTTFG